MRGKQTLTKFSDQENHNVIVTLDDGSEYRVYSNWIKNQDLDHWKGWHCHAGDTRLYIHHTLDVWSGECQNDYLGHAIDGFEMIEGGTICKRDRCHGCTDDLAVAKSKD